MPLVKASEAWRQATLKTPYGPAQRPAQGVGNFSLAISNWLIHQGLASAYDPDDSAAESTPPASDPENPTEEPTLPTSDPEASTPDPETSENPEDSEPVEGEGPQDSWETKALTFLNENTPEEIAQSIKGIGSVTAADLVAAKPLTLKKLQSVLTKRQLEALQAWAEPTGA